MSATASLELKWLDPAEVEPNPKNWRRHPPDQTHALDASLAAVGWAGAALFNKRTGRLVDGHLRQKQAKERGELLPVLVGEWTEEQEAYILATLDPIASAAHVDAEALDSLLAELNSAVSDGRLDADLGHLDALLADLARGGEEQAPASGLLPGADPDAIPSDVESRCKPGDLWRLGGPTGHRLLVGDSTKAEDVARLMGGERVQLVLADPPYGMRLDTDYRKMPESHVRGKQYAAVTGDDQDFDPAPFLAQFDYVKEQLWWGADYYHHRLPEGGSWIVWDKRSEASDSLIGNCFELCWSRQHHRREIKRHQWCGVTAHDPREKRTHPTQKPVALITELTEQFSEAGDVIYDPFLGSGTTMIAAESLGRRCFGIEIEPRYGDVALSRYESATGKTAELLERVEV